MGHRVSAAYLGVRRYVQGTKAVMRAMWTVLVFQWVMLITFIVICLVAGGEAHTIAGFQATQGISFPM